MDTDTRTEADDVQTLVALTPADMAPAQVQLAAWCVRKIAALEAELADLSANLELATAHGWKHKSVENTLNRTARRITYYQKMQRAAEAGYLLVPNMGVDLFAVRVARAKQPETAAQSKWSLPRAEPQAKLPAGAGRYVSDHLLYRDESVTQTVDGKMTLIRHFVTDDYDEVDFPVTLVKPAVLEATARAMALKVFDQMGVVRNEAPGRDPIVVGQLLDPRGNRLCTFFVAWWLDLASL